MASRTTQRVEEKKSMILAAAKDILIRKGRQTRMADIAEASGMETSSVYYYFKGVPEVLNALLHDQYRDLAQHEREVGSARLSDMDMLEEMVRYLLEFYHENFDLVQIIISHVSPLFQDPDLEEDSEAINDFLSAYRKADEILVNYLRRLQAAGELAAEYRPEALLTLLRGAMWGVIASWRLEYPPRATIGNYVNRILTIVAKH